MWYFHFTAIRWLQRHKNGILRCAYIRHRLSSVNEMKKLTRSQMLMSLHEAPVCFQSLGTCRSASCLNNVESVLCQNIIVPVSCREGSNKKRTLSQFHRATANLAQWWLEGHWAMVLSEGLVFKWDYSLVWKKEEKGVDAQASKGAEIFKCR